MTPKNETVWKLDVAALTGTRGGFAGQGLGNVPSIGQMTPGGMVFRALRFAPNDPVFAGKKIAAE